MVIRLEELRQHSMLTICSDCNSQLDLQPIAITNRICGHILAAQAMTCEKLY